MKSHPPVTAKELWAWSMYDFANSGYTTVVITAIFNAYFVGVIAGGASWATLLWTTIFAISYVFVMFLGPILGRYADRHASKKKMLLLSTIGCVIATLALAPIAGRGGELLWLACIVFIISNMFYAFGENFTASFLPELATSKHIAKVSAWAGVWVTSVAS